MQDMVKTTMQLDPKKNSSVLKTFAEVFKVVYEAIPSYAISAFSGDQYSSQVTLIHLHRRGVFGALCQGPVLAFSGEPLRPPCHGPCMSRQRRFCGRASGKNNSQNYRSFLRQLCGRNLLHSAMFWLFPFFKSLWPKAIFNYSSFGLITSAHVVETL